MCLWETLWNEGKKLLDMSIVWLNGILDNVPVAGNLLSHWYCCSETCRVQKPSLTFIWKEILDQSGMHVYFIKLVSKLHIGIYNSSHSKSHNLKLYRLYKIWTGKVWKFSIDSSNQRWFGNINKHWYKTKHQCSQIDSAYGISSFWILQVLLTKDDC